MERLTVAVQEAFGADGSAISIALAPVPPEDRGARVHRPVIAPHRDHLAEAPGH